MNEPRAWYNVHGWTMEDLLKGRNPSLNKTRVPENDFFGAQQQAIDFVISEGLGSSSSVERVELTDGIARINRIASFEGEEYL